MPDAVLHVPNHDSNTACVCRYLGCDKYGIPSATNDAISPEESFTCVVDPDTPGTFTLRTWREKYLAVVDQDKAAPEIRADADEPGPQSTLRIRMQARFKPTLKASKEEKVREKISRAQLEQEVGKSLTDDQVKKLKKARRDGSYHEALLDIKVKTKHDKFA